MAKKQKRKVHVKIKVRPKTIKKRPAKVLPQKKEKVKRAIVDVKTLLSMDEAVKYVVDIGADKGFETFKYLIDHGTLEENRLASKLGFQKANAIRKFLYKLYTKNLVSYIRKRHGVKAWFTYYWSANPERLVFLLQKEYEDEIEQVKKSMELNKVNDFYICNTCNRRYTINEALERDFKCSNCGSVLQHLAVENVLEDKQRRIEYLKNKINELASLVAYK